MNLKGKVLESTHRLLAWPRITLPMESYMTVTVFILFGKPSESNAVAQVVSPTWPRSTGNYSISQISCKDLRLMGRGWSVVPFLCYYIAGAYIRQIMGCSEKEKQPVFLLFFFNLFKLCSAFTQVLSSLMVKNKLSSFLLVWLINNHSFAFIVFT